ncbi:MAG: hypothetical protein ACMVO3_22815 [Thalassobaculum sp.]
MSSWDVFSVWRHLSPLMRGPTDAPLQVQCAANPLIASWRRARVSVDRERQTWTPAGDQPVLVVPIAWAELGAMVDLVAIDPTENEAYCLTGRALALGQHALEDHSTSRLAYHETAMDWVRDHGRGVCPLDEAFFSYVVGIGDLTLVAQSLDAGERLEAWIRRATPKVPVVAVRRPKKSTEAA